MKLGVCFAGPEPPPMRSLVSRRSRLAAARDQAGTCQVGCTVMNAFESIILLLIVQFNLRGQHLSSIDDAFLAGMRWSETGNYGTWDNPVMPNTFGAQVYDLGDPWAQVVRRREWQLFAK
jgi:hypothetical protein